MAIGIANRSDRAAQGLVPVAWMTRQGGQRRGDRQIEPVAFGRERVDRALA